MKEATTAALKTALEALEVYWGKAEHRRTKEDESKAVEAITAIKEALALTSTQCEVQDELCSSQEPVAWIIEYEVRAGGTNRGSSLKKFDYVWHKCSFVSEDKDAELDAITWRNRKETPLYTAPPKRPWVGLMGEEIDAIDQSMCGDREFYEPFARAIESKLEEKNT